MTGLFRLRIGFPVNRYWLVYCCLLLMTEVPTKLSALSARNTFNKKLRFLAVLGMTRKLLKITGSFLEKYNFIGDEILAP